MSDEPDGSDDDAGGTLVQFPRSGDSSYTPPPIPDFIDTIPSPEDIPQAPPESPEETTLELPRIPAAPDPATALRSEGIATPEIAEGDGESEEVNYAQSRSLADRLGDWLEFRLERARAIHESEGPFREAEIARKTALLAARTTRETALMEQTGKFHAALMKAKSDRAAARGKADADRMRSPSSGLGTDKGRPKPSGGTGSTGPSRANSGGTGGRSGPGSTAGGTGGRSGTKGPERPSGGRNTTSGPNGASGGGRGGQTGSGGPARDGGGRAPASNARAERARGRQERAAQRQSGRQERRNAGHAANVADRTHDRDQARAQRQAAWEDRRAKRQERDAARKAKRDAAAGRTTFGQAVADEAARRFDKRRAEAAAGSADTGKVNLTKDKDGRKSTNDLGAKSKKDGATTRDSAQGTNAGAGTAGGPTNKRRAWRRRATRTGRRGRPRGAGSPFGAENSTPTVEWPEHPTRPPQPDGRREDDIEDAVIIPDDPAAVTTGARGLPPAPERRFARPGTSRPTSRRRPEGSSVSSTQVSSSSGNSGLAAQHRTDITFDDYLMVMANIAIQAGADQERAEALSEALDKVADALRDMAADLIGDHNIATAVTDLIADLADAAARMKAQAERCATDCGVAMQAANLAATMVARVYGQDMAAKEDAGLRYASAAAHHD